jgi:prevent-host-death family protein
MKLVEMREANASLAEYARRVADEPVVITVDGQPVAALLSVSNVDLETISLSTNPEFVALVERARARQKHEGGSSSAELRRKLGLTR